jgi:hypothetical protein
MPAHLPEWAIAGKELEYPLGPSVGQLVVSRPKYIPLAEYTWSLLYHILFDF